MLLRIVVEDPVAFALPVPIIRGCWSVFCGSSELMLATSTPLKPTASSQCARDTTPVPAHPRRRSPRQAQHAAGPSRRAGGRLRSSTHSCSIHRHAPIVADSRFLCAAVRQTGMSSKPSRFTSEKSRSRPTSGSFIPSARETTIASTRLRFVFVSLAR